MLIEFSLEAGAALLGCHRAQTVEHAFVRQAHERQRQTNLAFLMVPVVVNRKMEHDPRRKCLHVNLPVCGWPWTRPIALPVDWVIHACLVPASGVEHRIVVVMAL